MTTLHPKTKKLEDTHKCCCAGSEQLPADVLGAYSVLLQSIQPLHAVPAALQRIKDAKSHADCLSALQHLGMLCSILSVITSAIALLTTHHWASAH